MMIGGKLDDVVKTHKVCFVRLAQVVVFIVRRARQVPREGADSVGSGCLSLAVDDLRTSIGDPTKCRIERVVVRRL